jgi:hypothetical protein
MNPIEAFGSGACAVTLLFFAAFGMMLSINNFIEKYPPLDYAGEGSLLLLVLYMLRGPVIWMCIGEALLWSAAYLAAEFWGIA